MNWDKILGNSIVAFATAAIAVNLVGASGATISAGFVAAILQGLLAFGAALQDEGKKEDEKPSRLNHLIIL